MGGLPVLNAVLEGRRLLRNDPDERRNGGDWTWTRFAAYCGALSRRRVRNADAGQHGQRSSSRVIHVPADSWRGNAGDGRAQGLVFAGANLLHWNATLLLG